MNTSKTLILDIDSQTPMCNLRKLKIVVKLIRAHGGYLGTQRRRRTQLPAIRPGELEASIDPGISEWGNPTYCHLNL